MGVPTGAFAGQGESNVGIDREHPMTCAAHMRAGAPGGLGATAAAARAWRDRQRRLPAAAGDVGALSYAAAAVRGARRSVSGTDRVC
jgi:hypothetical protein